MQGKILITRGMQNSGLELIVKAARLAKKYELLDIVLTSNDILRTYCPIGSGLKDYDYYNEHINETLCEFQKIQIAKEANYSIMADGPLRPGRHQDSKIRSYSLDGCRTKKAHYWYRMFTLKQQFKGKQFKDSLSEGLKLLTLLRSDPYLDSDSKKAEVYSIMAKSFLYTKEYKKSAEAANKGLELRLPCSWDYLDALQTSFYANYRCRNYSMAKSALLKANSCDQMNNACPSKWLLFDAALRFSEKKFEIVNKILHQANRSKQSTKEWSLGYKLLEVVNILELKDYEWFEYKLESLRKMLSHFKFDTNERIHLIYRLMRSLIRNNYNYKETIQTDKHSYNLLKGFQQSYNWDPMGIELVNFYDWMTDKSSE